MLVCLLIWCCWKGFESLVFWKRTHVTSSSRLCFNIYLAISKIESFDLRRGCLVWGEGVVCWSSNLQGRFFLTGCFTIPKMGKIGRPKFDGVLHRGYGTTGENREHELSKMSKRVVITCQVRE